MYIHDMYVCNKHFVNRARDSTELQTWSRRMKKSKQQGRKGVLRCDAPPTSAIVQSTRTETKEPNTMVFYTKKHTLCTACTCTYTTCVLTLYYLLLYYTPPPASHPDIAGGECKLFFWCFFFCLPCLDLAACRPFEMAKEDGLLLLRCFLCCFRVGILPSLVWLLLSLP